MTSEKQIAQQVLQQNYEFPHGELFLSLIKAGVENTNFLIENGPNKFVFRIYNLEHSIRGTRSKESIEQELEFSQQAIASGIPAPQVINNIDEERITTFLKEGIERYSALFAFLPGKSPEKYTTKRVSEVAGVVNTLYEVGKHFEKTTTHTDFDILSRALSKYEEIQTSTNDYPKDILVRLRQLHSEIEKALLSINLEQISKGFVHGDLKLENMLFDVNDNLTAVLDFDDYRYSYLLEEATMALMHNLHSSSENIIRSGNYQTFKTKLTHPVLIDELHYLSFFVQARFLYDLCKYLSQENYKLIDELLEDAYLKAIFE